MSTYAYLRRNAMEIHVDLRNVRSERAFLNKMKETFPCPTILVILWMAWMTACSLWNG